MNTQSAKKEMRARFQVQIKALPDLYIAESDSGIYKNVTSLSEYANARSIMLYHSVGKEPDTLLIAESALESGKTVAFPYCYRGGVMEARIINSLGELAPAMLGIPAPPGSAPVIAPGSLDMIIVPALAFDGYGYRLGYGGGYYDRFLRGLSAITVGLARQRLIVDSLPVEQHDVAVNIVITEDGVLQPPATTPGPTGHPLLKKGVNR